MFLIGRCGSLIVDTNLVFDAATTLNEENVNTILEQSAQNFQNYNLTLVDPGSVIIPTRK